MFMKSSYDLFLLISLKETLYEDKFSDLTINTIKERRERIIQTSSFELKTSRRIAEDLNKSSFISKN